MSNRIPFQKPYASAHDLDVDLEVESLQHPERYPLVIKRNALDFAGV